MLPFVTAKYLMNLRAMTLTEKITHHDGCYHHHQQTQQTKIMSTPNSSVKCAINPYVKSHKPKERMVGNENAMNLLSQLERVYTVDTIQKCLRSKSFPCPEVTQFLQTNPTLEFSLLQSAYEIIVQQPEYLGAQQRPQEQQTTSSSSSTNDNNDETPMDENHPPTSMWYMTRLGTTIRFFQLLLVAKVDPQKSALLMVDLLKIVPRQLQESVELWRQREDEQPKNNNTSENMDDENDDENDACDLYHQCVSQDYNPLQIACFGFAFLLRIKHVVREYRLDCFAPYWKALESLAGILSSHLPHDLLQDSLRALVGYLKQILKDLLPTAAAAVSAESSTATTTQQNAPQQFKFLSFFLARLAGFLKFLSVSGEGITLEEGFIEDLLRLLMVLRGLPMAIMYTGVRSSWNSQSAVVNNLWASFQKVSIKAESCLSLLLFTQSNMEGSDNVESEIGTEYVKGLLKLKPKRNGDDPVIDAVTSNDTTTRMYQSAFAVGKIQSLHSFVRLSLKQPPVLEDDTAIGSPRVLLEESNVNLLLSVCEHLLFRGLPLCYDLFTSNCLFGETNDNSLDQILDDNLHCISDVLYNCQTLAPCITTNADRGSASLHRLLLRWLTPTSGSTQNIHTKHHPFTRELVMSVLHCHAVRLHQHTSAEGSESTPPSLPFLSLLVKVLFDGRISTGHRANIACLLRRILANQPCSLSQELTNLVEAEYATKSPLEGNKKRKHENDKSQKMGGNSSLCSNTFSLEDVRLIASVLAHASNSSNQLICADIQHFCANVLPSTDGPRQRQKRLSRRDCKMAILVLARMESLFRRRQVPASVGDQRMLDGMTLIDVEHKFVEWFLSVWNLEAQEGQADQNRMESLLSFARALLRLVVTSSESIAPSLANSERLRNIYKLFDELSSTLIEKVSPQVNRVATSARTDQSRNEMRAKPSAFEILSINVVLETARALRVARLFPLEAAGEIVQGLVGVFQRILNCEACWSLHAPTITSLHNFSVSLSQEHSRLLINCMPKSQAKGLSKLLQARIRGNVYRYGKHQNLVNGSSAGKVNRVFTCMHSLLFHCAKELQMLVASASTPMRQMSLSMDVGAIPVASSLSISLGSYFMTMPTRGGRKAIVIFPPEQSSLEAIQDMWGGGGHDDEDNKLHVQQLRRVVLSQTGSCDMILK